MLHSDLSRVLPEGSPRRTEALFLMLVDSTRIGTPDGPRSVGELRVGDMVLTRDGGARPVLWSGRRMVQPATGPRAPVHVPAGVLGNDEDLLVAPDARLVVDGWRAELYFGSDEVLVVARDLVDGFVIRRTPADRMTYAQIYTGPCDLIDAGGQWVEARLPPVATLVTLDAMTRDALLPLYPGCEDLMLGPPAARPIVTASEAAVIRP
jgi:hypothetical protein